MRCHQLDYEILGDDMQIVEVELDPGETVIAEAGAMNYMEDGINFETRMGDGSQAKGGVFDALLNVGKRVLTGESIFLTHFTNQGQGKKRVAFAAPFPGKIIPLNMPEHGGRFICQKDSFLCAALGTSLSIALQRRLGTGFFGGEGFILQKLEGDGMAFAHAGGTVVKKVLTGETLRGHGTAYLQSLPFSRLADRIIASAPRMGGRSQGEGSVLGPLGRMLDGS